MPSVHWFRRDLRLSDNPALLEAVSAGGGDVLALFVLDPALWGPSGRVRRGYLGASLQALDAGLGGALHLRHGDPVQQVVAAATAVGGTSVYVSADTNPYGRRRDATVEAALAVAGVTLHRVGCPYAVAPGHVLKPDGTPYAVFTPFSRAWRGLGWPGPSPHPGEVAWVRAPGDDHARRLLSGAVADSPVPLPSAGEAAARRRWQEFRDAGADGLDGYAKRRDRPDLSGTSRLSHHLRWGEVHPRTLLADLEPRSGRGVDVFRSELAWREFYADVLWHQPDSAREYLRPEVARMAYDRPDERFDAWREGRTGFPFVDAGMRQLRGEGWLHNRVRMVVASFLCKDLHLDWRLGARHFMHWLRDGDLASNQHGWQWVAGSGTDAAPYFRVFNPVMQGLKFDPDGDYVRRWVPELAHLPGAAVHQPWEHPDGTAHGYPERVVDHATERAEALARYEAVR
jgi:deoxyribodipyrimidine photo-lyase